MDVASSMKNENHDITISNIIARADHFKEKAKEVNDYFIYQNFAWKEIFILLSTRKL